MIRYATEWSSTFARKGAALGVAALALIVAVSGCDSLLEVEPNPEEVPADALDDPTALQSRLVGTEAEFWFSHSHAIWYAGLFTDELIDATGFEEVDERRVQPSNGTIGSAGYNQDGIDGLWTPVQTAVATADGLQQDIADGSFPDQLPSAENSDEYARMSIFAGYAKLSLGELFCTTAFGGDGPELTSQETYAIAAEEFTQAIEASNVSEDVLYAALVGRARAHLMMGNDQSALSDAQRVPLEWEMVGDVFSSASIVEENELWDMITDSQRSSVGPDFRELTIDDTETADPRVDVFHDPNDQFGSDGSTVLWQARKYLSADAPVRLASGVEARYIVAELQGGQQAVDIINEVRDHQGIDVDWQPDDPTDEDEILRKVISERSRSLFLEGNRMGNMRRYLDRYGIDLFPTGEGFGDQTCMPLPNAERDFNPDI